MKEYEIDWGSIDTNLLNVRSEIIAYHLFLLELAKSSKKVKKEKDQENIIGTYKSLEKRDMEEKGCLKI